MTSFRAHLHEQRWDDHRFYHHSLVNQSLHFVSACTFLTCYMMMFRDPALASVLGWTVAMTTRQCGHFFFEPKGYDVMNDASHEYKEEVKVGYNLARKWVFMTIWALVPVALWVNPTMFGLFAAPTAKIEWLRHLGVVWLALAGGGLLFRVAQLCVSRGVQTGLVWGTKILTDPFNDFVLYRKAPGRLLRGERFDNWVPAEVAH